jgi:hypothetical protein
MFSMSLRLADHVREYSVSARQGAGWEIKLQEDRTLTRHVWYRDWHRVERTLGIFRQEVAELTAQGWQIQPTHRLSQPTT